MSIKKIVKNYLGIVISLLVIVGSLVYVKSLKEKIKNVNNIGNFTSSPSCAKEPNFLQKLRIPKPIAIDLSQRQYKGLAFLYGQGLRQSLHLKTWEKFDYFSTYSLDPQGNMFLSPMPFISVKEKTFEFQQNIYKLDTHSGKLSVWMSLGDVHAGANNPYGIIALSYDCDDDTLWVSAIDETDYHENRGVIYHIDIKSKKILHHVEGVDALSLKLIKSDKGKFLLFGGAKKNWLYALDLKTLKLSKLFELPNMHDHIRKIKVRGDNLLELQSIPFSYSLIAQTTEGEERKFYLLKWDNDTLSWKISFK